MAAIEAPGMIARILLIGKVSSAALPFQSYFVFRHVLYMECGQALGNRLFLRGSLDLRLSPAGTDGFLLGAHQAPPPQQSLCGTGRSTRIYLTGLYTKAERADVVAALADNDAPRLRDRRVWMLNRPRS